MDGRAGRREAADGVEMATDAASAGQSRPSRRQRKMMWGGGNKGWWVGGRVGGQAGGWAGQNTTTVGVYPGLLNNYLGRKFTQKRREIAPQTPQRAIFRMRRWWVNTLSLIPHLTCARHDDRKTKTTITSRAEYGSRLKSSRLTKCGVPPKTSSSRGLVCGVGGVHQYDAGDTREDTGARLYRTGTARAWV